MKGLTRLFSVLFFLFALSTAYGQEEESDTLKYPFDNQSGGLYLDNQIHYEIVYDPIKDQYVLWPKIGDIIVGDPIFISSADYLDLILKRNIDTYYKEKSRAFDEMYRSNQFGDKESED